METLGDRLRALRIIRHKTQADIARICGVSREAVSQWESGKYCPTVANIVPIVEQLDGCFRWVMVGKGERTVDAFRRALRQASQIGGNGTIVLDDDFRIVRRERD